MFKRISLVIISLLSLLASFGFAQEKTSFTVRIENVSNENTLQTMSGNVAVPLSPGIWELHTEAAPFFTTGEADRGMGLEALAEDGDPSMLFEAANAMMMAGDVGFFNTPLGASEPGVILPGQAYEFSFETTPGHHLSLATMFVQSNDWFYAPGEAGIALFDDAGNPISGEVTDQVLLWDAGTEVDEEPGTGAHQAPRQMGPNDGEAQNGVISLVDAMSSHLAAPVIKVTITVNQ